MYWVIGILTLIGIIVGIFTILKKDRKLGISHPVCDCRSENRTLDYFFPCFSLYVIDRHKYNSNHPP